MKMSKDELKQKISDSITDNDDLVIELLEDIEDSMTETVDNSKEVNDLMDQNEYLQAKYDELKTKYKERFLTKSDDIDNNDSDESEDEVIDVKEI